MLSGQLQVAQEQGTGLGAGLVGPWGAAALGLLVLLTAGCGDRAVLSAEGAVWVSTVAGTEPGHAPSETLTPETGPDGPSSVVVTAGDTIHFIGGGGRLFRLDHGGLVATDARGLDGSALATSVDGTTLYLSRQWTIWARSVVDGTERWLAGEQHQNLPCYGAAEHACCKDGPPEQARFLHVVSLAVRSSTVLVCGVCGLRRVTVDSGTVATNPLGGEGELAGVVALSDVAVGADGTIYIAADHRIYRLRQDHLELVAGSGTPGFRDGPAQSARFGQLLALAVDRDNTLFVADAQNHRIRVVRAGQVSTLAGTGAAGYVDGEAQAARFHYPQDLALTAAGELIVADKYNGCLRRISNLRP